MRPDCGYFQDGRRIISNTEAIGIFRQMMGPEEAIANRGRIGTAAHRATAWLDEHKLLWDTAPFEELVDFDRVSPEVAAYSRAWEKCKRETGMVILSDEHGDPMIEKTLIVQQNGYHFATTLDVYALLFNEPAIVEKKCIKVPDPWWGPQLCGQDLAMNIAYGPPKQHPWKRRLVVCQLFSDGSGYKLHDKDKTGLAFDSPENRRLFLCCLEAQAWRTNHYGFKER